MGRSINKLTTRYVQIAKKTGRHADGGGLYLRITPHGSRSWVFMTTHLGKRAEIGLGAVSALSLATARSIATQMREAVALGKDPRTTISPPDAAIGPVSPTFGGFADMYIGSVESGWRNPVHRQQWRNSLRDHAANLRDTPIDQIGTDEVLAVLEPIWLEIPETANRVRGRIERILDAAKARGLRARDSTNPAAWRGHLALLLPPRSKLTRGHHAALSWEEAPAFMGKLRDRSAMAARCLEFVILTAARSGEGLGATWSEINFDHALWTVPRARMKAGVEHVVPLSRAATNLLMQISPASLSPEERIFGIPGAARSNMAMAMLLRRMGRSEITVHGFRSTFRDWAGDATNYPRELVEGALAHTIGNKAERAYRRGTAVERRRELMQAWSDYLTS
jgi:integrase